MNDVDNLIQSLEQKEALNLAPALLREPFYSLDGDCLFFHTKDEARVADPITEHLTLFRSAVDNDVVGFQITNFERIRACLSEDEMMEPLASALVSIVTLQQNSVEHSRGYLKAIWLALEYNLKSPLRYILDAKDRALKEKERKP